MMLIYWCKRSYVCTGINTTANIHTFTGGLGELNFFEDGTFTGSQLLWDQWLCTNQFKFLLKNFSSTAFRLVHALLAAFTASGAINFQIQHQTAPQPRPDLASLFLRNLNFYFVLTSSGTMRLSLAFNRADLGISKSWNQSNTRVYTTAFVMK